MSEAVELTTLTTASLTASLLIPTTPENMEDRCRQGSLTGAFGVAVQFLLALIAFSCLIVKRFCEPVGQRRPWRVWFYDTSKQGFGATLIHFANILLAKIRSGSNDGDPCIWYVLNFLLDSTVGLIFIYITLRILELIFTCCNCKDLKNGEYGDPPKCKRWALQCVVYTLVLVAEKGVVMAVMTIPIFTTISNFIMSPIKNANFELVLVMFVIPIIVNAIMFWVVDNLLMKNLRINTKDSKSYKYAKLKSDIEMEESEHLHSNSNSTKRHHDA